MCVRVCVWGHGECVHATSLCLKALDTLDDAARRGCRCRCRCSSSSSHASSNAAASNSERVRPNVFIVAACATAALSAAGTASPPANHAYAVAIHHGKACGSGHHWRPASSTANANANANASASANTTGTALQLSRDSGPNRGHYHRSGSRTACRWQAGWSKLRGRLLGSRRHGTGGEGGRLKLLLDGRAEGGGG